MRPAVWLALLLLGLATLDAGFYQQSRRERLRWQDERPRVAIVTAALGLTDLCLATEARYTRNPAVSDPLAPFMDHPGSLEHFPTGSFWAYPARTAEDRP
jgi:hypothetical protein